MQVDLLGEEIRPTYYINPLVYRNPHKSENQISSFSRKYDFKDFISITPNAVLLYSRNIAPNDRDYTTEWLNKGAFFDNEGVLQTKHIPKPPRNNSQYGLISNKANKNVQRCIDWMVTLAKDKPMCTAQGYGYTFRLNFITLTLSEKQKHTDVEFKRLVFQPFLDYLRKYEWLDAQRQSRKLKYYFWRAESQANGNIHFHICTDAYIDKRIIQWNWNRFLDKAGYNARSPIFAKSQAPSTHVRSIHKVSKIASYLSKYCGKNSKGVQILAYSKMFSIPSRSIIFFTPKKYLPIKDKTKFFRPIFGKLWSCSENLSRLKRSSYRLTEEIEKEIFTYKSKFPKKVFLSDFCQIFKIDATKLLQLNMPFLRSLFLKHCTTSINPKPS